MTSACRKVRLTLNAIPQSLHIPPVVTVEHHHLEGEYLAGARLTLCNLLCSNTTTLSACAAPPPPPRAPSPIDPMLTTPPTIPLVPALPAPAPPAPAPPAPALSSPLRPERLRCPPGVPSPGSFAGVVGGVVYVDVSCSSGSASSARLEFTSWRNAVVGVAQAKVVDPLRPHLVPNPADRRHRSVRPLAEPQDVAYRTLSDTFIKKRL